MASVVVREGDLLAGKYRVERHLGHGGMGYVVAAVHEQLQQRVAVKFLSPEHSKSRDASARFLREARAAVRIQSEHVARVLDVAELEGGAPYMVMEFLNGNDLDAELTQQGSFELTTAVDYLLQASEAVAEAHSLGLVHRDLKPSNLFLTRRADGSELVKVLDFGISKAIAADVAEDSASLTSTQAILGSPAYMSPEQARQPKSVDPRTDIWSLGIILYQFLTGTTPFTGDTPLSILAAAFVDDVPDVHPTRPELPEEIDAVIKRCLQKDPKQRYQTIAELAQALEPFARAHSRTSIERIRNTIARPSSSFPPRVPSVRAPSAVAQADTQPDPLTPPASQGEAASGTVLLEGPPPGTANASGPTKSKTVTEWGKSHSEQKHSRFRVALVVGVSVVVGGAGVRWLTSGAGSSGREAELPTAEPLRSVDPKAATARATAELGVPVVPPAQTLVLPSGVAEAVPAAASAVPSASVRRAQPRTKPRNVSAAPPAKVEEEDPLDGRR
jgi:serine/threonine-protein kinase